MKKIEPTSKRGGLIRIRLDIAYDGTNYSGFGIQPHRKTVQGELNKALQQFLSIAKPKTIGAGRTDAGVHARGQVVHFDVEENVWQKVKDPLYKFRRILPADIQVKSYEVTHPDFDARYSALTRRYSYTICNSQNGSDPMSSRYVLDYRKKLNVSLMNKASKELIGLHDFIAFCKTRSGSTTIRDLKKFKWMRTGDYVTCEVVADAFCYSMVRGLIGVLLQVGDESKSVNWPKELLKKRIKVAEVNVVAAKALVLEEVKYPTNSKLKAQYEITRRTRHLEGIS